MSQLDALLERSRAPGTFIERSRFTLARSKAIEKMREFSLRHPRQYVLELVQAAVFAEARWIAIDATDHSMVVAWVGGKTLSRRELEALFDYLFSDQGVHDTRHLMQAAVGVNAILQRRPQRLRIESGDGTIAGTVRMDLDKKGQGSVGTPESPLAGTYIFADFGHTWFSRFASTTSVPPEAGLVETRCLYTPVPILLNGSAPFGYRASRSVQLFGVRRSKDLNIQDRRGTLGVPEARVRPGIRMVVGGVWISERLIELLGPDLVGVICDDALRKTADMSDIVEDARFVDMLHAVQPTATALIRDANGPSYHPPRLPRRVAEKVGSSESEEAPAEPLPEPLPQLGKRPRIGIAALHAMEPTEPLFWVDVESSAEIAPSCDPSIFPWRVVILTPGQARTLAGQLGDEGPTASQLTNREDVSFVRNAMERRVRTHEVKVPITLDLDGRDKVRATLTLALHLEGPTPRIDGVRKSHDVPLVLMHQQRTVTTSGIDLPLPGVRVIVHIDQPMAPPLDAPMHAAIREAVMQETWRLLPGVQDLDPRRRRLVLSLLARWARPAFVREHGGVRIGTRFPTAWRAVIRTLLDTTLAETTTGPLTLSRLVELQGTDEVLTLTDPTQRDAIEELERRFGYGHVAVEGEERSPLVVAGRAEESWRPLSRAALEQPNLQELVLISSCLRTPQASVGWRQLDDLAPGIGHWVREGHEPMALREGLRVAMRRMHAHLSTYFHGRHDSVSTERATAMGELAMLRLGTLCDELGEVRLQTTNKATHPASLLLADRDLRVACHGGATHPDEHVLPATIDMLQALEHARAARLKLVDPIPLVLDDDPALWTAAPGAEDGWLVQQRVQLSGLDGWLGLRHPWDPTPGVLVEAADHLYTLPGLIARVPCHGMLTQKSDREVGAREQELLLFSGIQLYQELLRLLHTDLEGPRLHSAMLYATRFACIEHRLGAGLQGLAMKLAQRVEVRHEDRRWGSLADWLESAPDARPPTPPGVPDLTAPEWRMERASEAMNEGTWSTLAAPLRGALQLQAGNSTLQIRETDGDQQKHTLRVAIVHSTSKSCTLDLVRTPVAAAALHGDARARGLLLMEGARQVAAWAKAFGAGIDPLELQRAVLAHQLANSLDG